MTNPDDESIGQFTKAKRLFNHVLEECIEEAGESGLIQPVQGTVSDAEGATAESLGLVHVRDLRASKTFTELIRVISQAMATKEYQRAKVLMQLMGKKTLGMDVARNSVLGQLQQLPRHLAPCTAKQVTCLR